MNTRIDLSSDDVTKINSASGNESSRLEDLVAKATLKYSLKDYDTAAELYAYATELQAKIHGEMSLENANLLYHYGRCLYHVAIKKSDVLGIAAVASSGPSANKSTNEIKASDVSHTASSEVHIEAEDQQGALINERMSSDDHSPRLGDVSAEKRFFEFKGDERWDISDDEDGEDADDAGPENEQDDFLDAFEVLDMARVLLQRKLLTAETNNGDAADKDMEPHSRQLKERLADTHDLQAEISLEGEKFSAAVDDFKSSLRLKQAFLPEESSLIAESHYKLSLALEFLAVTMQKTAVERNDSGHDPGAHLEVRQEAAEELELAIASCRLRLQREEDGLAQMSRPDAQTYARAAKSDIDDVKDMLGELEQRLLDIRQPFDPPNTSKETGSLAMQDALTEPTGIFKSMLDATPAARLEKLKVASETANDLTNLIKKKPGASVALQSMPTTIGRPSDKRKDRELDVTKADKRAKLDHTV